MSKNKKLVFMAICLFLLAFAGCGKSDETPETEANPANTAQPARIEELNESGELLPMAQIQWYDKESYQPYWNCNEQHRMTRADDGYYFAGFNKSGAENLFLGHVSSDGIDCIPVCGDAACDHESDECIKSCTAYFDAYSAQVWYYKDYIYVIKKDKGNTVLVRVKPDGTSREELFEIGTVGANDQVYNTLTFYDDCIYTYDRATNAIMLEGDGTFIRKRSLDGRTDEIIVESKERKCVFNNARCYGGNLFFTYYTTYYDAEARGIVHESKGLYCYDCHTGKTGRILDSNISDYAIDMDAGKLYCFVMYEGLYEYEFATGEKKLIYAVEENTQICAMSYDGKYFLLDNRDWIQYVDFDEIGHPRTITVLTKDGSKVNEIKSQGTSVLFGDNMLFLFAGGEFAHEIGRRGEGIYVRFGAGYIEKSQIESAQDYKNSVWP